MRGGRATVSPRRATATVDLWLSTGDESEGLGCHFEYNTDLFDAATITRLAGHFQTLLEGIVADPGQCVAALPLLPPGERRQLLLEWNDTAAAYPDDTAATKKN